MEAPAADSASPSGREPADGIGSIGVLDSGIGGLSVLRAIHQLLPTYPTTFFADQQHLPYGPRPAQELRTYVFEIARWLMADGARLIVLACNTASAAALIPLREAFPDFPFVGMEPAVKPAAEATRSGVIGVLATRTTAEGPLYERVLDRYARHVRVITRVAPEFVHLAETQTQDSAEGRAVIEQHIAPIRAAGADQIVLACTHFPFLAAAIQRAAGPGVTLIDPAPAVARQVARLSASFQPLPRESRYVTSGDVSAFRDRIIQLTGIEAAPRRLPWGAQDRLTADSTEPP